MSAAKKLNLESHVVDILGSTRGRDQPIMLMEKAFALVSLIDKNAFLDKNTVILDPFCKAGEILLAAAIKSCQINSSETLTLLDTNSILKDMFNGRYFGISPDQRHFLLSKRTFYGNEYSHNTQLAKYIKCGDYLSEVDGRLDSQKYTKELAHMIEYIKTQNSNARIVAIGNPPYQESDGGFGKSASPIYNYFVESLLDSPDISEFVLVIPARWFSGGKGLDDFRDRIITSKKVKCIEMFKDPRAVFPTVDINGGICFLSIDKGHKSTCRIVESGKIQNVDLSSLDAIPDDLAAYELIEKVRAKCGTFMSDYVLSRNPFGITTTTLRDMKDAESKTAVCMIKERQKIKIPKRLITKNHELINKFKVVVPAAVGGTKAVRDFLPVNQFFIVDPGIALSETYIIIGAFDSKTDAEKLLTYVKSIFCRYFIGLRKLTQHLSKDCWSWVPQLDFKQKWDDEKLFEYFKFSKQEQAHVRKMVQEWS